MEFDDLLDNIKEASDEPDNNQEDLPEAEKLASMLEKLAEYDKEREKHKPVEKVAEAIKIVEVLEEEGLV